MKFTLSWLKEHLDTNASLEEITTKLTDLGLELESVEDRAATFAAFKVAHVVSAEKHPDADRLKVLVVDTGKEKLQVVCGGPNARAGMMGIFAPEGSVVPSTGAIMKKGNIRGQESNGMMASATEMGLPLEDESKAGHIIDLPDTIKIGTPFADIFGLNEIVIDVAVTPNRADCAGVHGIARDLAAAGLGKLIEPAVKPIGGKFKSPLTIKTEDLSTPIFLTRYIRGVKNGASTPEMQAKLKAIGSRPISALVDVTNFMSIDRCRPLHVFDADKIKGDMILRKAKKGESFEALNGKTYVMQDGMAVANDDTGIIDLLGTMGGAGTSVSEDTVNVLLECAYFDPTRIAKTGRALEILSDARYRFERGVDPAATFEEIERATKMIIDLCGGEASEICVTGTMPDWKRSYDFDAAYTEKLTGVNVPEKRQIEILKSLGFEVSGKKASPPSWRADIQGKADLAEEVVRIEGFDKIPALSVNTGAIQAETENFARSRKARTALAARGLYECVTWSFMKKETAALFGSNDNPALALTNPISSELSQMRPSILPNLIEAAQKNADRGYHNTALFEVGPAFTSVKKEGQKTVAAGVRHVSNGSRHWSGADAARNVDALDAKADALAALAAAGAPTGNLQVSRDAPSYYHPGRSGSLRLGANVLAYFGEIHPAVLDDMGVKGPVAAFEAFLNNAPAAKKKGSAKPLLVLSQFQPVQRDFAFLVDDTIESDAIIRAARSPDKMIETIEVFDIYKGKGVEPGKKSVAINVIIQPKDKTLSDAEIEGITKKIVEAVTSKCGASLRG